LNRALALVRPVSMTDETASDWLAAAIGETADMSDAAFKAAVGRARKSCTYHGQIIPTIAAEAREYSKPDPYSWALACHQTSRQMPALTDDRSGAKQIGDVAKRLTFE